MLFESFRSLPERFRSKITAIEESKDLEAITIEELVGYLQTYKLTVSQPKKNKSTVLNTIRDEESNSTNIKTFK